MYIVKFDHLQEDENSSNCCLCLLHLVDESFEQLVLGPCFRNHQQISASLRPCFPRKARELLPIQKSLVANIWTSETPSFRGFPSPKIDVHRWFVRLRDNVPTHLAWMRASIYVALDVSMLSYNLNLGLLGAVISFWSPSINYFFFP